MSRAVYTMCKKTFDLAEDGFPKDSFPHILGVHCTNIIEIIEFRVALVMIYAVLLNFDFVAKLTVKI